MNNFKTLMPSTNTKNLLDGDEIICPRYFIGEPRDYRLNLGKGVLELASGQQLTKQGEGFKVLPIAVRCFEDAVFGQPEKKWMEVYFINQRNQIGMFMFHGFSVDNLSVRTRELRYDGKSLCDVSWKVLLDQKINKDGQKYYMADFAFDEHTEEDLTILKGALNNVLDSHFHIYRHGTRGAKTLYHENWSDGKTKTEKEIQAEKELEAKRLAEFEPKKLEADSKPAESKKRAKKKLEKVA